MVVSRVIVLGMAVALAVAGPAWAAAGKRVALVIGQGRYEHIGALANPPSDARLMARTLGDLGFTLVGDGPRLDLDKRAFDDAVRAFGRAIEGAEVALFFYAGHGLQVDGANWLVPVSANPVRAADLGFEMANAEMVLAQMREAGTRLNLVILDACRNNPFQGRGLRGVEAGLAQMRAPRGTVISYATQPGNVAADGGGGNSPFTLALAGALRQPGLDIFHLFNRVALEVERATGGAQQPWTSTSPIEGDFRFGPPPPAPSPQAALPPAPEPAATPADRMAAAERAYELGQYGRALPLFTALAGQGDPRAMDRLGEMHAYGQGVARDDARAQPWFARAAVRHREAAAAGDAAAMYRLGEMHERGEGLPEDAAMAREWYARALERHREAAGRGDVAAMMRIAEMHDRGQGVPESRAKAREWYAKAAEIHRKAALDGDAKAQDAYGDMLLRGLGMPANPTEAAKWLRKAAARGMLNAQIGLSLMFGSHAKSYGVKAPDHAEALKWERAAAEQGHAMSQYSLGMYYMGMTDPPKSGPRDPVAAYGWFTLAIDGYAAGVDHDMVASFRDPLARQLTPAQIEKARQWVRDWKPTGGPER